MKSLSIYFISFPSGLFMNELKSSVNIQSDDFQFSE